MPCIKGNINAKIHEMFVIIKKGEIVNIYVSIMLILMITNKIKNDSVFEKLKLFLYILNKSLFSHLKVLYLMAK